MALIKDLDSVWQAVSLFLMTSLIGKKIRLRLDGRCSSTRTKWIACAGPSTGLKLGDGNSFSIPSTAWYMTRCSQRSPLTGSKRIERKAPPLVQVRRENAVQTALIASARSGAGIQSVQSRSMCWLPRRLPGDSEPARGNRKSYADRHDWAVPGNAQQEPQGRTVATLL